MTVRQGQRRIARQKPRGTARHSAALNCAETWTTENCWDKDRLSGSTKNRNGRGRAVTVSTRSRRRRRRRRRRSIRIVTTPRALQLAAVTEVLQRELWRSADCSSWPPIDCKRRSARIVQRVLCVEQLLTARPNQLRQRRDPVLLTSEWPEGKPAELWATC
jgi:hypothetical protein